MLWDNTGSEIQLFFFRKTPGSGFARGIAACYITANQGTFMNLLFAYNSLIQFAGQVHDGRLA